MIWRKLIKDFWAIKSKTFLAFASLTLGIFGLSTVIYTYSISKRDLRDNYIQTNPASVILIGENLSSDLLKKVEQLNYVSEAEIRDLTVLRARSGKSYNWLPVYIFAPEDFSGKKLNNFTLESGTFPGSDEILIERDGEIFLDGSKIYFQLKSGNEVILEKSGIVHDPGLPPSHMDHLLYAYVNRNTFDKYFRTSDNSRLLVQFSENRYDFNSIEKKSIKLIEFINNNGGKIKQYLIPPPGEHPHQGQLSSLLFLQAGLGSLAVLLSILLLINVVNAIMREQIKQIGIMKSTGATVYQLLRIYLSGIIALSAAAILVALPAGYQTSLAYSGYIAYQLNFNLINKEIPFLINVLIISGALTVPLLATIYPVLSVTKLKVKDALNFQNSASSEVFFNPVVSIKKIPLWFKISLNNTFRKKMRLILSVFTLMLGLALLSVSLNISSSLDNTFRQNMNMKKYDFSLELKNLYDVHEVEKSFQNIPEIKEKELWIKTKASFTGKNDLKYDEFSFTGFYDSTKMWNPDVIKGELPVNWNNTLVINSAFSGKYPSVNPGDSITLFSGGKKNKWYVAAVINDIGAESVYTSYSVLQRNAGHNYLQTDLKIKSHPSKISFYKTILDIENNLERNGIFVTQSLNQSEFLVILQDHVGVILNFLLAVAGLVLAVGGIGMTSIMNINIMERNHEIGIMRALGAVKWKVNRILITEFLIIGIMSWLSAWFLSRPLSKIINDFFGKLILENDLNFIVNQNGFIITFIIMNLILISSSLFPLRYAQKVPVKGILN